MNRKAWKLVLNGKSLSQGYYTNINFFHTVDYSNSLGKTIRPHLGKLFCFSTKEHLLIFLGDNYSENDYLQNLQIIYGTAYNVGYPKQMCVKTRDYQDFWKIKEQKKRMYLETFVPPEGTITCSSFRVEEIITL